MIIEQLKQPVFMSTIVWAWALHHMPMFDDGIQISLSVSVLSYPAALIVAYLAVYRHKLLSAAMLLLATVILAHLYFDYSFWGIAESLLYISVTGLFYVFGMRYMTRLVQRKKEERQVR